MKRFWMLLFWLAAGAASAQLQVQSAYWQVIGGGAWCDAGRQMAEACNGKSYCQMYVDPRYLCGGDPAVGRAKTLNVTYTCAGRAQPVLAFPDGAQAVLKCNSGVVNPPPPGNSGWVPPAPSKPNGSDRGKLQVFSARWEVIGGGASCDATDQLIRACDGKSFCQMFVHPRYLCRGDPAPNQEKRLEIRYACNGERQAPVAFNDFAEAVLRCRGHHDGGYAGGVVVTPPGHQPGGLYSGVVVHSARWEVIGGGPWCDATQQMVEACNGQSYCQVPVDANNLCNGDPAVGRKKNLLINYSCNGKRQTPIAYPDFAQAVVRCDGQINRPVGAGPHGGTVKIRSARWEQIGGGGWCDPTPQLVQECDGKTHCRFRVDADHLCDGDPALNKLKRLDVHYSCGGRPQQPLGFLDFANAVISCE